jgi:hypothetical protein
LFKFNAYDEADLTRCREQLLPDLESLRSDLTLRSDRATWTELILNWFANAAPDSVVVDTSKSRQIRRNGPATGSSSQFTIERHGYGETLRVDQMHWRGWPAYEKVAYWCEDYWTKALESPEQLECVLALECEWTGRDDKAHYREVMHEAAKLLTIRSNVKVVVLSSYRVGLRDKVHNDIRTLRMKGADKAPWLLVDVPHGDWSAKELQPHIELISPETR